MDIARMIKKATGISIAAFIDQSIETAYSRQTKAVKAKIQYNNLKN